MSKKPCIPPDIPPTNFDWEQLIQYIGTANRAIARYDGTLGGIVNPGVLLSPITNREAVLSSKIEGTNASMVEVLQHEAGEKYEEDKKGDINEVINYRRALLMGEDYLLERPVTLHLIRQLHAILMDNVRGAEQSPGDFRKEQNWIGPKGCNMEQARFVPPDPVAMQGHLDKLQNFIDTDYFDPLVQLAIVHAQFEIIHPFNDGNGRLGRMLIPLFLYQKGVLQRPIFYLSEYIEAHDAEYRDRLLAITEEGNWHDWIVFFLTALHDQAHINNKKAQNILGLYESMKIAFSEATKSQYALTALDTFFTKPIINASEFYERSRIKHRTTATNILRELQKHELIITVREGAGRNPTIYAMPALINEAEGENIIA